MELILDGMGPGNTLLQFITFGLGPDDTGTPSTPATGSFWTPQSAEEITWTPQSS
jgi:hypothetical protein